MAGRKAKTSQLLLAGALAVGLGYLLGTWTLNLLLPKTELPDRKQPQVTASEGEEFSDNVPVEERSQVASAPQEEEQLPSPEPEPVEEPKGPSLWRVVVDYANAPQLEEAKAKLGKAGYESISSGEHQLQLGVFQEQERAANLVAELQAQGFLARVEEKL